MERHSREEAGLCGRLLPAVLIVIGSLSFSSLADADAPELLVESGVQVQNAFATESLRGEATEVRFQIENEVSYPIVILGLVSTIAEEAKLVARIGSEETTVLDSISVPPRDMLDLTTSHLWFELSPLNRDLKAGETITVTLRLVRGDIPVEVHVH